jgi:predicted cupin superfamily sugar epimerase
MNPALEIINKLNLQTHPEGGYFNEIYRSDDMIDKISLPKRYNGDRSISTSIYYMLEGEQVSLFHKLKSDEIWHFYTGSPIILHCLDEDKGYQKILIGNNIFNNEIPQYVIKQGIWFAAEVADKDSFSLVGCTVAPGFDFSDFQFAAKDELIKKFPVYKELIERFTK